MATGVRPTAAVLREALFSIWHQRLAGSRFLDLFAGSGGVGLEALSRGAKEAVFVDCAPRVLKVLRSNCERLAPEASRVRRRRLATRLHLSPSGGTAAGRRSDRHLGDPPFDLIFADPPYRFADFEALLQVSVPWLAVEGEMAVEHSRRVEVPAVAARLRRLTGRSYGESCLSFYRRVG